MPEISRLERELLAAVGAGLRLDLSGREPITHAEMPDWGADREISAKVIRDILTGRAGGQSDPRGLRLRGARIVGRLDLDGLRTGVWFSLHDCDVVEPIRMRGAELPLLDLNGCRINGLDAENTRISTVVLLSDGFASTRTISLLGASLGGKLDLGGARLDGNGGTALAATGLQVAGSAYLNCGLVATGAGPNATVRLVGARIGGLLSLREARIDNPDGVALNADSIQVTDMLTLAGAAELSGEGEHGAVRLVAARISGALSLGDAILRNATGPALVAHYLDVAGTAYLDGIRATGMVRVAGGRVGRLTMVDSRVDNPRGPALDATRLVASQGMDLAGAQFRGCHPWLAAAHLRGAQIGGELDLRGAMLSNTGGGPALRASHASVEGQAILTRLVIEQGDVNLRDATLGALRDEPARLPAATRLTLDGLTYRGLPGAQTVSTGPVEQRVGWLRRMPEYAAQPYRQLAAAYQAAGHEDQARRILIAQQQHLLDSGLLGGRSRLRQRLLGATLGYGYESWRAVVGLVGTLLIAVLLLVFTDGATARVPAPASGPAQSCVVAERLNLAVDETVPLIDTGVRDRCDLDTTTGVGQVVSLATLGLRLLGWGFATLVLAGYTGLVRRN
ncbi:MAG TPA: hypothetical protein VMU51_39375 [Mycobacteriales bacterium]|nr:hypothetical protein [Mycobacteriales bacterium]